MTVSNTIKENKSESKITLTLLHTNDMHSHFNETSRIANYFDQVRSQVSREKLIILDSGDFLDRAFMETEGTDGAVNRAILENMGYDAVLIGRRQ